MHLARKADIACVRKRTVGLGEAVSRKYTIRVTLAVVPLKSPLIRPLICGCAALSTLDSNDRYNSLHAALPATWTGKTGAISPTASL